MVSIDDISALVDDDATPPAPKSFAVTVDAKGNLILPPTPERDDHAGQCSWLTNVFNLDAAHPVTGAAHQGLRGALGHVAVYRAGAQDVRFEPASRINQPARLIEDLCWQTLPSDGAVHALKATHCRVIAHVVRMLTNASDTITAEEEAGAIVGSFTASAIAVEGHHSYGTSGQRHEAAAALGPQRYLIDADTGELVIGVGDLQAVARQHIGSSLPRGWLDARMAALGWQRTRIDGHALAGRDGREGPHAHRDAYRGHLPNAPQNRAVTP